MKRYFTVEEANQALEALRPLMAEILAIRDWLAAEHPALLPVLEKIAGNGGSPAASQMVSEFARIEALVHMIEAQGVLVKDVNQGLLDFPSLREGREVYLCWQYGEGRIAFWHEVEAGFAGRQAL